MDSQPSTAVGSAGVADKRATVALGTVSAVPPVAAAAQDASMEGADEEKEGQQGLQASAASPAAERGAAVVPESQQHPAALQHNTQNANAQSRGIVAAGTGTAGRRSAAVRLSKDGPFNVQLVKWGLSQETARDALNPGFSDPFPAATTVTLDNPAYRWLGFSLMRGKLDWALLRRLRVHSTHVGNLDYGLSDHRWLAAEVSLE
ncbi:hypothetical protein N2152v2_004287 [Parachlorella kessleri]